MASLSTFPLTGHPGPSIHQSPGSPCPLFPSYPPPPFCLARTCLIFEGLLQDHHLQEAHPSYLMSLFPLYSIPDRKGGRFLLEVNLLAQNQPGILLRHRVLDLELGPKLCLSHNPQVMPSGVYKKKTKQKNMDFIGGTVIKNLCVRAGNTGSIPGPEDSTCCGTAKPMSPNY